jgi:hypothetical protein
METTEPWRAWKTPAEKPVVRTPWFQVGLVPAMISGGEIRAASTSAAVLPLGGANSR